MQQRRPGLQGGAESVSRGASLETAGTGAGREAGKRSGKEEVEVVHPNPDGQKGTRRTQRKMVTCAEAGFGDGARDPGGQEVDCAGYVWVIWMGRWGSHSVLRWLEGGHLPQLGSAAARQAI